MTDLDLEARLHKIELIHIFKDGKLPNHSYAQGIKVEYRQELAPYDNHYSRHGYQVLGTDNTFTSLDAAFAESFDGQIGSDNRYKQSGYVYLDEGADYQFRVHHTSGFATGPDKDFILRIDGQEVTSSSPSDIVWRDLDGSWLPYGLGTVTLARGLHKIELIYERNGSRGAPELAYARSGKVDFTVLIARTYSPSSAIYRIMLF